MFRIKFASLFSSSDSQQIELKLGRHIAFIAIGIAYDANSKGHLRSDSKQTRELGIFASTEKCELKQSTDDG